jgi:hypothetical protein
MAGVEQSLLHGDVKHDTVVVVGAHVGISMRVKVDERQWSVMAVVGAEQRERHIMVTADGKDAMARLRQRSGLGLESVGHFDQVSWREVDVPAINDPQALF